MLDRYHRATRPFSTIVDFLRYGVSRAEQETLYFGHGTDNACDDIRALVLGSLSLPFDMPDSWLVSKLSDDEKQLLCNRLHDRIENNIPTAYLLKKAYFCGLPFYVDERVLIPRSPIAELIEQQFQPWVEAKDLHILDMCTGSGCIAIACAMAFPDASVDGVDISKEALQVAKKNGDDYMLTDRVNWIESDLFKNLNKQRYDLIVSNPPYVSSEEMRTLPKEYHHEPKLALTANDSGLAIVKNILKQAAAYLTETGILVVEVGNSKDALIDEYPAIPFTWLEFERGGDGVFLLTAKQLVRYFK